MPAAGTARRDDALLKSQSHSKWLWISPAMDGQRLQLEQLARRRLVQPGFCAMPTYSLCGLSAERGVAGLFTRHVHQNGSGRPYNIRRSERLVLARDICGADLCWTAAPRFATSGVVERIFYTGLDHELARLARDPKRSRRMERRATQGAWSRFAPASCGIATSASRCLEVTTVKRSILLVIQPTQRPTSWTRQDTASTHRLYLN